MLQCPCSNDNRKPPNSKPYSIIKILRLILATKVHSAACGRNQIFSHKVTQRDTKKKYLHRFYCPCNVIYETFSRMRPGKSCQKNKKLKDCNTKIHKVEEKNKADSLLIKSFCRGVQGGQFFQKAPPLAAGGTSCN